jgi:lipid A 4'-phosphatase
MPVRLYWALWGAAAALFTLFPHIDIWFSDRFTRPFDLFWLAQAEPFASLRTLTPVMIWGSVAVAVALPIFAHFKRRPQRAFAIRAAVFVLLSLAIGPGLIVNAGLKDHWGRARPSQIVEFGGTHLFTPALQPAHECARNCSFVAGDPSAGFFLLAFALLVPLPWRRPAIAGALGVGLLLGLSRIAQGGHFLSDVVFAGLIVGGVTWLLHTLIMVPDGPHRIVQATGRALAAGRRLAIGRGVAWQRRLGAAAIVLGLAALVSMLVIDQPVARAVHRLDPDLRHLFEAITNIGLGGPWFILTGLMLAACLIVRPLCATIAAERRWRARLYVPLFFLACLATAGIANTILKYLFGRMRPTLLFSGDHYGFTLFKGAAAYSGFPSGHAETIFTVATALTLVWPRHVVAYYMVACLIAASRVMVGAHYPSDVVAGGFLGVAAVLWVHHVFAAHGVTMAGALAGEATWQGGPRFAGRVPGMIGRLSLVGKIRSGVSACLAEVRSVALYRFYKKER